MDQPRELDDTLFLLLGWLGLGDKADLVLIPFLPKIPERAEGAWLHQKSLRRAITVLEKPLVHLLNHRVEPMRLTIDFARNGQADLRVSDPGTVNPRLTK